MTRRGAGAVAAAALLASALAACSRPDRLHDANNELPFGKIDVPAEAARVPAQTPVSGWALDDIGIREIRLFVDGRFAGVAKVTQERPDIKMAYPNYWRRGRRAGWTGQVAFDVPGSHVILAQAVDTDGATRDIGTVNVTATER